MSYELNLGKLGNLHEKFKRMTKVIANRLKDTLPQPALWSVEALQPVIK
jgi:hypothetical protein